MTHTDIIFTNGPVYTMDQAAPRAQAVAVKGRRVVGVGAGADILALRGPRTQVIDLAGRPLLPAFADSHIHFSKLALQSQQLDLTAAGSASGVAAIVARAASKTPEGHWLRGIGWDRNTWPDPALPGRDLLDQIAPRHPVALASKDLHTLWVNSAALAAAGVSGDTADPPGGVIVRRPQSNEPAGILLEAATKLVSAVYPQPTLAELAAGIGEATRVAWSLGITNIHQMGDTPDGRAFQAFQHLDSRGALGLRVLHYLPRESLHAAVGLGLRSGFGSQRLRIGGIKLFADGSLGSRTAWMLEPFADEPHNYGVAWLDPQELRHEVRRASQAGLAVAVHAIGNRANREVIDAIAAASAASAASADLRHRIEHAQLLHADDMPRLAHLGIVASMQPLHCPADILMADRHWGEPRNQGAYAWRSLLDSGVTLAFGSDGPVEPISVLQGIHAAVTRRRADGSPDPQGWHPEQRLSVTEAVRAYTLGPAIAAGEERWRGSIAPGKLADLVVLSHDIFAGDPMDISAARVEMTLFDGQIVHGL
jgi:predicted amidohydrolase YtcJ